MSTIKLVISDLHLADGHTILDGFGDYQQSALEGLLNAASPNGPLGQAEDVELIINGDCFDFLVTPPYDTDGTINAIQAVDKLAKIIAAHHPFFDALRAFITLPGRHITFITGNHDIELSFAEVRAGIYEAISVDESRRGRFTVPTADLSASISFCPTRFYRPLPDVYLEHGNHYDFWNRCISGLWDEQGRSQESPPLPRNPDTITLPVGSHYLQHAWLPTSLRYPYLDHFEPSINIMRQIALLCLLDPAMVVEIIHHTMEMLSQPRKGLIHLAPGDERIPARLFEQAMLDLAAFQQDVATRTDAKDLKGASQAPLRTPMTAPPGMEDSQAQANIIMELNMLRDTLALPPTEAIAALCTPTTYQMGESVAAGMHNILKNEPGLRYALAGHTHMVRIDPTNDGTQVYLNTASWTRRLALPAPGEITAELIDWLRHPDWEHIPLRDVTQLTFAMINAGTGVMNHAPTGPSSASLCVWEGGVNGSYRVLA